MDGKGSCQVMLRVILSHWSCCSLAVSQEHSTMSLRSSSAPDWTPAREQVTLHTAHCTLHTTHCTLHTARCTLPTAHCKLHTSHIQEIPSIVT